MLNQLGRRRRDRKSQELNGTEQNNTRAECACLPRASGLTRRNVLVRAKSEEQTTVQRRRQLVRAASEDHHARCPAPATRPPSPPQPKPKNLLTRAKSEEQQGATRCQLLRTNSDGRRYKVSNLQRQAACQDGASLA